MVIEALICPRCGAPLPPFAAPTVSCCTFCGSTVRMSERTTTIEKDSNSPVTSAAELKRRTRQFDEAVRQAFAADSKAGGPDDDRRYATAQAEGMVAVLSGATPTRWPTLRSE